MVLGERENLSYSASLKEAAAGADAIFALIEWPDIVGFIMFYLEKKAKSVMVDARNQLTTKTEQPDISTWGSEGRHVFICG